MGMVRKSFILTERNNEWLQNMVATGLFGDESEIIHHLIRDKMMMEHEAPEQVSSIREALEDGKNSGPMIAMSREDIFEDAKAYAKHSV